MENSRIRKQSLKPSHYSAHCRLFSTLLIVVVIPTLAGCVAMDEGVVPDDQTEAGTSHTQVTFVAPWKKMVASLQPTFSLTPANALTEAIPNTSDSSQVDAQIVQTALEAGIKGGTPSAAAAPTLPSASAPPSNSIGQDAFKTFWSANYLYEEVQILNRSLKYAPKLKGYHGYVVTADVSMVPNANNEAVNAFTLLSFFPGDFGAPTVADGAAQIVVYPILLEDDLEAQAATSSREQLASYALALSAALHAVSVGADFNDTYEKLKSSLNSNYNSVFTVESDATNTIRCRFGATYSSSGLTLQTQHHSVPLLILVPDAIKSVLYTSKTTFTDLKGDELETTRSYESVHDGILGVLRKFGLLDDAKVTNQAKKDFVSHSVDAIIESIGGNGGADAMPKVVRQFQAQELCGCSARPDDPDYCEELWVDLVSEARTLSKFSNYSFELPDEVDALPSYLQGQSPVLVDDGSSITTTVHLANSIDETDTVRAYLTDSAGKSKVFSSTNAVDENGDLALTFPEIIGGTATGALAKAVTLTVCDSKDGTILSGPALYYTKKPDAPFKSTIHSNFISAQQGTGAVDIVLDTIPKKGDPAGTVVLTADGADIGTVTDSSADSPKTPALTVAFLNGQWTAKGQGIATVSLKNLAASQPVTMTVALSDPTDPTSTKSPQTKVLSVTDQSSQSKQTSTTPATP